MSEVRRRILVIEDNMGDVLLIREALKAGGIPAQVDVLRDGEEAQRAFETMEAIAAPDLIILDLNLPRVGGMTLLGAIRSRAILSKTPVMVLSSSRAPQDRAQAEQLGADEFVSKPLTLDDFLKSIGAAAHRVLSKRTGGDANPGSSTHRARRRHPRRRPRFQHRPTDSGPVSRRVLSSNNFR